MTLTSAYAAITKSEKQADGSLLVTGVATDATLDIDEQICDPAWLKQAMPDWFKWGNVREQHSSIAAGTAIEYSEKDAQHVIVARIVDPSSVKKVEAGVLKGFSIGIRNPRIAADKDASGGRIVDGQIVEVSLVDRPANPACTLALAKSASTLTPGTVIDPTTVIAGTDLVKMETLSETTDVSGDKSVSVALDAAVLNKAVAHAIAKATKKADKSAAKAAATPVLPEGTDPVLTDLVATLAKQAKKIKRLTKAITELGSAAKDAAAKSTEALTKATSVEVNAEATTKQVAAFAKTVQTPGAARVGTTQVPVVKTTATKAADYRRKATDLYASDRSLSEAYTAMADDLDNQATS